jgi:hypothetical protein
MEAQIPDEILGTDSRIRYAGILDKDLKTVSSKARKNLTWEKENLDHQMVALASPIILGTLSRFTAKNRKTDLLRRQILQWNLPFIQNEQRLSGREH